MIIEGKGRKGRETKLSGQERIEVDKDRKGRQGIKKGTGRD